MMRAIRPLLLVISIFKSRDFINIAKDKPRRYPTTDIKPPSNSDKVVEIPMLLLPADGKIKQVAIKADTVYSDSITKETAEELQIGI